MEKVPCPACGSLDVVEIVYGMPDSALFEEAQRGEVVVGGCVIEPGAPGWRCASCSTTFGEFEWDDESSR